MHKYGPIAFFLRSTSPKEYVFKNDTSEASFKKLAYIANYRRLDLRFVLGENSFQKGIFTNYWTFKKGTFIHVKEGFIARMIHAKHRSLIFDDVIRVNNPFIENICIDKLLTAQTFPRFVKKTLPINENTLSHVRTIETDLVVVKPQFGSDGVNVKVLPKEEITKETIQNDKYIIQELIDSSGGIPNLINQRHEMRIYVFNDTIQSAYLRLPPENSYLCNVAQGAVEKQITLNQIPSSFITAVSEVDKTFSHITPRHYTVDMMYEIDRPWIVELNNTPGLPDVKVQPLTDNYFNSLLDLWIGKDIPGIKLNQP